MKKSIVFILLIFISISIYAQKLKKDGTPDMRYKENKENYSPSSNNDYKMPDYGTTTSPNVRLQKSYIKSNGTIVKEHIKTNIDRTDGDNFSADNNQNPYTKSKGHRARNYTPEAKNYGKGHTIETGPNGGQYYHNSKGKKVYVPKRN